MTRRFVSLGSCILAIPDRLDIGNCIVSQHSGLDAIVRQSQGLEDAATASQPTRCIAISLPGKIAKESSAPQLAFPSYPFIQSGSSLG
jgi:hypothetical protein